MELTKQYANEDHSEFILAHQFKLGEEEGMCLMVIEWGRPTLFYYSGDMKPEEYQEKRDKYRGLGNETPYVIVDGRRIQVKANQWIIKEASGKIDLLPSRDFKRCYHLVEQVV